MSTIPPSAAPLGVPASRAFAPSQTQAFKELVNKFAWALGSTYRMPYQLRNSPVRSVALELASSVVSEHGYPEYLTK